MLGQRDRALVEPGVRVGRGVPAVRDRHPAEVLAGRAELVHVAAGHHGDGGGRRGDAHRVVPAVVHARGGGHGRGARRHPAEPASGPLVQRPVADHHGGRAGRDGHRRVLHGRARGAAAVADLAEVAQPRDAELAGDRDLGVAVHGEGDQAVHVGRGEPGVVQRGPHRLGGEPELAAAGVLGELGRPDAGDGGGLHGRGRGGHRAILTVAVTWSPRLHRPVTATTSSSRACPLRVSVSPAWQGTPSRMETARTTASGAQADT